MGTSEPCHFETLFTKHVPHIIEKIFFSLDYESLHMCLSVSKTWKEAITTESFQRRAKYVFRQDMFETAKKLQAASKNGNLEDVRKLLSLCMWNVSNVRRKYCLLRRMYHVDPLCEATIGGHTDVVKLLLDNGAQPNCQNQSGCTPLYSAVRLDHKEIVHLLLEAGAKPDHAPSLNSP